MQRTIKKIINDQGQVELGHFSEPVNQLNGQDFDYRTVMGKPAGSLRQHFAYKQFQYFGAIGKDLIFGCAFADIRYIGACFAYVFRPSDKKMLTWQFKSPLAAGLNMACRTDNDQSTFKSGKNHASQVYALNENGERRKHLGISFGNELNIEAWMHEPKDYQTQSVCTPCAVNGWVYAQKTASLPVLGTLKCELGEFDLSELDCYGHHDFSAGYMRRDTFWNWACFSLPPTNSRPALGLNISWGVNESGFSENCIWIGTRCIALPQTQFFYDRDNKMGQWKIQSSDGSINLNFDAEGKHSEELNLFVLATDFHQIFGKFNGTIEIVGEPTITIENVWGFVEHQFSRW
ncbi:hypothetical protein A3715_16600 [Oleiphilus sp. HI0009]|nr:DUF2804 domain-containing protein [Oleiphilus sp. HI0125]KZX86221.1 hypothetical protein A3715_16600 [Oleiphilus sp. HI0009]KZY67085.1 hypothetical protein A3738_05225 [Oleiphilus sp. HI0066]KZY75656.1 hypothetical protein A3739_14490 [Oleiphilus sp. HI0067]KZZ56832.1 hypothetical protein A3762_10770 [Oleiphilus sp. HI0125]